MHSNSSNSSLAENVQNAHQRLLAEREEFLKLWGRYPSVMYVGSEIYRLGFPVAHSYPVKCWAIEDTLIIEKPECGEWGIMIPAGQQGERIAHG